MSRTAKKEELLYIRTPLEGMPTMAELEQQYDNRDDRAACILHHLVESAHAVNTHNREHAEQTNNAPANFSDYFSTKNIGPEIKRRLLPNALKRHNEILNQPTAFVGFNLEQQETQNDR